LSEIKGRFSKILAAIDGSEQFFKAAEYAIQIAKKKSIRKSSLEYNNSTSASDETVLLIPFYETVKG
jgi:nucleotide-binding universal stress UspA family protein